MQDIKSLDSNAPAHEVVGVITAFWTVALTGHHILLPALGFSSSYNTSPIANAVYYALFSLLATAYFWKLFRSWATSDIAIWRDLGLSLLTAVGIALGILFITTASRPSVIVSVDLFFATPWYFLPKAFDVLFQQILISTLILEIYARTRSLNNTVILYAMLFALAHIALFGWNGAPLLYSGPITLWSFASALVFPYLLLRVRSGFVYNYAIHLSSYIVLAMIWHTWLTPGTFGV